MAKHPQLPHYSTHAREYFHQAELDAKRLLGMPAHFEAFLADYLQDAVKFLLPDNGYLFADHDFKPAMFDLQRLPFPMCALEFTADDTLYAQGSGLVQSAKRIALCFDPWQLPAKQKDRMTRLRGCPWSEGLPERAIAVMAVYAIGSSIWSAAVGLVIVDLDGDGPMLRTAGEAAGLGELAAAVGSRLRKQGGKYGLPATFLTFPAISHANGQGPEQAAENLFIDTIDEVRTVYEFLAAVNCANVGTQDIPAPRMLNERRLKKGKTPFFGYKVLDLAPAGVPGGRTNGGTHASPRVHLRRGHPRQLHEMHGGKAIWINATTVAGAKGECFQEQVYKVRGAPATEP